ncbi:MAG: hypothetical protein GWP19_04880 [Planctomycetia bacterium]|nr:hypothetical protein [Planctomycetia bacterium]
MTIFGWIIVIGLYTVVGFVYFAIAAYLDGNWTLPMVAYFHLIIVATVVLYLFYLGIPQFLLSNLPSSWWLLLTIPTLIIFPRTVPWIIGPAGISPVFYACGIINPVKFAVPAAPNAGRLTFVGYWLTSSLYEILVAILLIINLVLLIGLFV